MAITVIDERESLTHRRCAPACRRGGGRDRVGGLRARRPEPAFARLECAGHGRRDHTVVVPQVRSGAGVFAARCRVGGVITPDPLDGVDGTPTVANPYHYADNDPLNKTDPLGLRPTEGEFLNGSCVEVAGDCMPDGLDGDDEMTFIFGQVESARNVAIYLPAAGAGPGNYTGEASQLYAKASQIGSVAVLAWLGYSPPSGIGTVIHNPNSGVAPQLADIVHFLKSRGKTVSVIGHSWSGQVLQGALFEGTFRSVDAGQSSAVPDNAIFVGAHGNYGIGNDILAEHAPSHLRIWWACNSWDLICAGEDDPPDGMTEFGSACEGCDWKRHSYFNTGSLALCNMAHIVVGRYVQVDGPACREPG